MLYYGNVDRIGVKVTGLWLKLVEIIIVPAILYGTLAWTNFKKKEIAARKDAWNSFKTCTMNTEMYTILWILMETGYWTIQQRTEEKKLLQQIVD